MEKKNKFISRARNVFDRAVTLFPRVDQLWVGHRQESCSDRQLPALATQPQDCTNNTIEKTMDQTGKSPNPDQEMANSELGRPTYGPWMTVTNQKRKAEGSLPNRGNKAQMGNKFHDLKEKGGPVKDQGQTSRTNEELGFHYKTNNSPIVENISHSPLATTKANNGEDIRLGSEFQNLQTRHQNSYSNTMAQMSNSIPSTHSGNPPPTTTEATLLQQANPQVQVQPQAKTRKPPDKNGGRRRELPRRTTHSESKQSDGVSHTRKRSISPHCLRRVDRGSKNQDSTMEADRNGSGVSHDIGSGIEIHGGQPKESKGTYGLC
ncbi:unnamed protein product [Camellia sinensis]